MVHRVSGPLDGLRFKSRLGRVQVLAINRRLGFADSGIIMVNGRIESRAVLDFRRNVLGALHGVVQDGNKDGLLATVILERRIDDRWPPTSSQNRLGVVYDELLRLRTDEHGRFRAEGLLPGQYRLSATTVDSAATVEARVPEGTKVKVSLQLRAAAITGRVFPKPADSEDLYAVVEQDGLSWDGDVHRDGSFDFKGLGVGTATVFIRDRNAPSLPPMARVLGIKQGDRQLVHLRHGTTTPSPICGFSSFGRMTRQHSQAAKTGRVENAGCPFRLGTS